MNLSAFAECFVTISEVVKTKGLAVDFLGFSDVFLADWFLFFGVLKALFGR